MDLAIDENFFKNYSGSGKAYKKVWRDYCYFDECCEIFQAPDAPSLKSVCVLGTATGEICQAFYKKLGIKIHGCELSPWAHEQTPSEFKARIRCMDMQDYIARIRKKQQKFTLVFSNSLIYLPEEKIENFLGELSECTRFLHVRSSTTGSACYDPWRKTLRPYRWWNERILGAGFKEVPGKRGVRSYLWELR